MSTNHVIVVGAGMVGLSTAWYLQRSGMQVSVIERGEVAAGASAGNAGWLTPQLVLPLAEPQLLKSAFAMALSPRSPLYIPPSPDPRLWRFLAEFTRHCTPRRWHVAASALAAASGRMYAAFDEITQSVEAPVNADVTPAEPFLAAFSSASEGKALLRELEDVAQLGGAPKFRVIEGAELRAANPVLSEKAGFGVVLDDQRFINPSAFVHALKAAVLAGGGQIFTDDQVTDVSQTGPEVVVRCGSGRTVTGDAAVLATGAWLGQIARKHGVRKVVQAGRGYSFTVYPEAPVKSPLYLPAKRIACTPLGGDEDGFRVAGMMEFRSRDAPLDPRRIDAIVQSAATMMTGIDWTARTDEWVGPRPCTGDCVPLIGRTKSDRVFVAGGHGMWGISLGPLTGKLLAEQIVTGQADPLLLAFDPLRP